MKPAVNLYKLGRLPYVKALEFQQVLFDKLKRQVTSSESSSFLSSEQNNYQTSNLNRNLGSVGKSSLILVEHEPVYTIGIRSRQYNDDFVSKLKRKLEEYELKADFVNTNRGGLITFHGPGQLVAYPIIYLGDFTRTKKSLKAYVNLLETTIIETLASIGLNDAHTIREHPGVWLNNGESKIAFIGISCKRYVTMHGISINCNCDLSWFDHIVSCGIEDKEITSIRKELTARCEIDRTSVDKPSIDLDAKTASGAIATPNQDREDTRPRDSIDYISEAFCQSFSRNFQCDLREVPTNDYPSDDLST